MATHDYSTPIEMTDYLVRYMPNDNQIARLVRYHFGIDWWKPEDVRSRRELLPKGSTRTPTEQPMSMSQSDILAAQQGSAALLRALARFFLKYAHIRENLRPAEIEYYRRCAK